MKNIGGMFLEVIEDDNIGDEGFVTLIIDEVNLCFAAGITGPVFWRLRFWGVVIDRYCRFQLRCVLGPNNICRYLVWRICWVDVFVITGGVIETFGVGVVEECLFGFDGVCLLAFV